MFWLEMLRAAGKRPVWEDPGSFSRTILAGAGLGLAWGLVARVWMRLISTSPEFSVGGTVFVLLVPTIFGSAVALAHIGQRCGWGRVLRGTTRALVLATFIPFGFGGGGPLMLTVLLTTLAWIGVTPKYLLVGLHLMPLLALLLGSPLVALVLAFFLAAGWLAWTYHEPLRKWARANVGGPRLPNSLRVLLAAGALGMFLFTAVELFRDHGLVAGLAYLFLYVLLLGPVIWALRFGLLASPHAPSLVPPLDGAFRAGAPS